MRPLDAQYSGLTKTASRPASIATGAQLEPCTGGPAQRPGSLALGTLADSALLNRLPHDQRPGSLAAPINTLGIPPPPARAVSHMGLNTVGPPRPVDHSIFRSQDLGRTTNGGWDHRANQRQESNGLVSIIDQVTSSLLEHGDSPPPKTLPSDMASPSTPIQTSSSYSQPGLGGKNQPEVTVPANSSTSHTYQTTTTTYTATSRSVGPTNFTQDQPRGEVLHPTPHRPSLLSPSGSRPSHDTLQESPSAPETHSNGTASHSKGGHITNDLVNNINHPETSVTPQKPTSKLPSRIPALGMKAPQRDPLSPSQPPMSHTDSRIPTTPQDAVRRNSGSPESQMPTASRLQTPGSIARSPAIQEPKLTPDTKIPSMTSPISPYDRPTPGESRIPTLGNIGRSPSGPVKEIQSPHDSHKVEHHSVNEQHNESRIPMMSPSGHAPESHHSKIGRPSPGEAGRYGSQARPLTSGQAGGGASGIPTLGSQGRSNSGLGSNLPSPGGLGGKLNTSNSSYGHTKSPSSGGEAGQPHHSKIQSPVYSSGIRPPSIHSPSQQQPQQQQQQQPHTPRGYSSGIRPPTINAAINTPGIPIPSPLGTPGSRSSVTSTGSGSRIPYAAGASSKIPAPGTNKHRVSPSFGQSSDAAKANHSAWMFGQHKNARVVCQNFPVVIEKNPDLGFTIGQSHSDPDDKSIYVTNVVGGGAASSALKIGDKLLQVDGVDLRTADLPTATSILNKTLSTVSLMVSRVQ